MVPKFPLLLLTAVMLMPGWVRAQGPLNRDAPLVPADQGRPAPSEALRTLATAQRLQELGLPSMAATNYRQLLAMPAGAGGDRAQITLALTTALLDDGDIAGAEQVLQTQPLALRGSAWHLRAGLIAAYQKKVEAARAELAAVRRNELVPGDESWWFFLQATIANLVNDARSLDLYGQAVASAQSDMARARFLLSQDQARLALGKVLQSDLDGARKNMENTQGKSIGYSIAREYAIMLDAFGQKGPAVAVLTQQFRTLPPNELAEADNLRLLLGLIAGAGNGAGRNALTQLLASGGNMEKQRIALQLLARASREGAAKVDFRRQLGELIEAAKPSPILDDLLAFRAQLALDEKNHAQAEKDANALLEKFPGSQLKAQALGILTSAAWERGFYRNAADYATKARAELKPPEGRQARAELGVLIAEALFRAEDFPNASGAYNEALAEPPEGVAKGRLMFQRVLAEIKAANFDGTRLLAVEPLLDRLARDPAFDAVNRWQAEWNLAQALLAAGETTGAGNRVNQLLAAAVPATGAVAGSGPALPAELRARMAWLQAWLSFETGQPEQTLKLADGLAGVLDGLDPKLRAEMELRTEIASRRVLLKAQADFALASGAAAKIHEEAAMDALGKLRADFPGSDAALYSYIIQADYHEKRDNIGDAQRQLAKLVDAFPKSPYASYATYKTALFEEKRGQYDPAIRRLEQLVTDYGPERLNKDYPQSDLIFAARLKEGDLYMKLIQFPQAQRIYEALRDQFPLHPGLLAAELALADCHAAQAADDEQHADRAKEGYDRLLALPLAPPDLRVEAGFKLGNNLTRRGDLKRAEEVWSRDVVDAFLLNPERFARLGSDGQYWMSRTLLELGDLKKKQDKSDEARKVWQWILQMKLPAENTARAKLDPAPPEPNAPAPANR